MRVYEVKKAADCGPEEVVLVATDFSVKTPSELKGKLNENADAFGGRTFELHPERKGGFPYERITGTKQITLKF